MNINFNSFSKNNLIALLERLCTGFFKLDELHINKMAFKNFWLDYFNSNSFIETCSYKTPINLFERYEYKYDYFEYTLTINFNISLIQKALQFGSIDYMILNLSEIKNDLFFTYIPDCQFCYKNVSPIAIQFPSNAEKLILIDGNHRVSALCDSGNYNTDIINVLNYYLEKECFMDGLSYILYHLIFSCAACCEAPVLYLYDRLNKSIDYNAYLNLLKQLL